MFRFWSCAIPECPNSAAIDIGCCERCRAIYCHAHTESVLHTCEPLDNDEWLAAQTAELVALRSRTDDNALLEQARNLNGQKNCRLNSQDPLGRSLMGGMHIHREILFEDGTTSFTDELSNKILLSECATLRWLESVNAPTPHLYGYGLRGDEQNKVGVAYMLIEKLPGQPFDSHAASDEQRSKVMSHWAQILSNLAKHPFHKAGSLAFGVDGVIEVGPVASDRTGSLPCIGPFDTAQELYSSWAKAYLNLIADGQLFSSFPVEAFLMFRYLLHQIEKGTWLDRWPELNTGPFFLKHADDKGDHILVDKDFRITGVIDWTFAKVVPAYEAFGPSLLSANNTDLFSGRPGLSADDQVLGQHLRHSGLPFYFFDSDEMRRFLFGLGMGLGLSKTEAVSVFQAIVETFQGETIDWELVRTSALNDPRENPELIAIQDKFAPRSAIMQSVDRFKTCSYPDCHGPSVRNRSCAMCKRHLCAIHIQRQYHTCPSTGQIDDTIWESNIRKEIEQLLALVNVDELIQVAISLRHGKKCTFKPGPYLGPEALMGCANYHAWIQFDDGVRWLARFPRTTSFSDFPSDLVEYLVQSEYATLKWLETLEIPTPKAHGFGLASDPTNLVGVSYLLEDAMPGQVYDAHAATAEQKLYVYRQYAAMLVQIRSHGLARACSLVPENSNIGQGPIASNRFLNLGKLGPFSTARQYFTSVAEAHIELIADGQLYPEYPKEACLFYKLLRDEAAPALSPVEAEAERFYLKHVDDKGDHLLVDADYNITGIIDWQFARFVPASEAFSPSLFTVDLNMLYDGIPGLSPDDKLLAANLRDLSNGDLACCRNESELARRFHFGLASGLRRNEVLRMIGAVISLLGSNGGRSGLPMSDGDLEAWITEEWRLSSREPWHTRVQELLRKLETAPK
ncbi:hypothetical protein F66182_3156 [Fusarium sp. NRRL 66182]|nr:hypothetical protein F66182_3156 [Fusarium sp. NRRL 66182]